MRRSLLAALSLLLALPVAPSSASPASTLTPYGREDNALGTLRWLPRNALETAPSGQNRLVVVYDQSLNEAGAAIPLKAKGAFGMKVFTTSHNVTMTGHSSSVQDLRQFTGQDVPPAVDQNAIAVAGDVRDGACSKLTTGGFSQAYSTQRSFFHPGPTPYAPISAPGTCETVDASTEIRDVEGNVVGYQTTVTNHVPGFWINVSWPTVVLPAGLGTGRTAPEVWYGGAYDSAGDPGPFPNGVDTTGASKSIGTPGDYTATFSFTGQPGGVGVECVNTGGNGQSRPGTFQDIKVQVPAGSTRVTFLLFPKGDWDLLVFDPEGTKRTSGAFGVNEQSVAPASTNNANANSPNFPTLIPGEYTMRGCNFAGETTVMGAVIIE